MKKICKNCFVSEDEHCVPNYIEVPDKCLCDIGTWDLDRDKIPDICNEFKGNPNESIYCTECEHEYACHIKE